MRNRRYLLQKITRIHDMVVSLYDKVSREFVKIVVSEIAFYNARTLNDLSYLWEMILWQLCHSLHQPPKSFEEIELVNG